MSRFANPEARERLALGPCECPGTPHDEDWIELRTELGAEDAIAIAGGNSIDALVVLVVAWNLLDHDGTTAPVDRDHIARLFTDNFGPLDGWIEQHVRMTALPNRLAARSRTTSGPSGSRPTRIRKKAA